ncbi:hypothetical protein A2U01_0084070, partial [Trifolium medium]|nr:hypothetical protein [Trifolium medium]
GEVPFPEDPRGSTPRDMSYRGHDKLFPRRWDILWPGMAYCASHLPLFVLNIRLGFREELG